MLTPGIFQRSKFIQCSILESQVHCFGLGSERLHERERSEISSLLGAFPANNLTNILVASVNIQVKSLCQIASLILPTRRGSG
jgi:hypothetical protein